MSTATVPVERDTDSAPGAIEVNVSFETTLGLLAAFFIGFYAPVAGSIAATVMKINVFHNGEPVYTRNQPFGGNQLTQEIGNQFNLSSEESEIAKRSGNLPGNYAADVLQPFCETLAIEVMRAIQFFYTSTQYTEVNYIFIAGGCAVIPGLKEIIASRTQVSTFVVNPFANMELSSRIISRQLNLDAPSLMIACGLALRSFDPS